MLSAVRADEIAHVLDETDDFDIKLMRKADALSGIQHGHLLRRGHKDCTGKVRNALADGKLLVACSGRRIDEQVIKGAPLDIGQKLLDHAELQRSAEDYRLVRVAYCKAQAHHLEPFPGTYGQDACPFLVGLQDCSLAAEHLGDVGSVDIRIQDTYGVSHCKQRIGEVHRHGALSHSAFSAHDQYLAVYLCHPVVDVDFLYLCLVGHITLL